MIVDSAAIGARILPGMSATTISALAAAGPVTIDQPVILPASLPFRNVVTFRNNGTLIVPAGMTATFTSEPSAPDRQIFFGTGTVAGLPVSKVVWFAGSLLNTNSDALALLQRAYDATTSSGETDWPVGFYVISGANPIAASKGQRTVGSGKSKSLLYFNSRTTNGFLLSGPDNGSIQDMTLGQLPSLSASAPTGGEAIRVTARYVTLRDITTNRTWIAVDTSGIATRIDSVDFNDSFNIGLYIHDTNDVHLHDFIIAALYDRLSICRLSGSLSAGDRLRGRTSGATATLANVVTANAELMVSTDAVNFAANETVVDTTSGASFLLGSQTVPHALGGIRLLNKVEGFVASAGDIIGGRYGMTTDATQNVVGSRPAYDKLTDIFFDSSDNGVSINNSVDFDLTSDWFSNRPGNGITLSNTDGMRLIGGGAINNWQNGVVINDSAVRTVLNGFAARGNSVSAAGSYAGVAIGSGTTDFSITNGIFGGSIGFGTQSYGIMIEPGSSNRYIVTGNLVSGNQTGGLSDGGTGADKTVGGNW